MYVWWLVECKCVSMWCEMVSDNKKNVGSQQQQQSDTVGESCDAGTRGWWSLDTWYWSPCTGVGSAVISCVSTTPPTSWHALSSQKNICKIFNNIIRTTTYTPQSFWKYLNPQIKCTHLRSLYKHKILKRQRKYFSFLYPVSYPAFWSQVSSSRNLNIWYLYAV